MARKKTADPEVAAPVAPAAKKGKKKESKAEAVPVAPVVVVPVLPPPTRDQIAARALALWRAGSADTVGNWLSAERQLLAERDVAGGSEA